MYKYVRSSKHTLEEVTVTSGREVASPGAHSKPRKQEWPHGINGGFCIAGCIFPASGTVQACWRSLVYTNMNALNVPAHVTHTNSCPHQRVSVITPSGSRLWLWVSLELCLVFF